MGRGVPLEIQNISIPLIAAPQQRKLFSSTYQYATLDAIYRLLNSEVRVVRATYTGNNDGWLKQDDVFFVDLADGRVQLLVHWHKVLWVCYTCMDIHNMCNTTDKEYG